MASRDRRISFKYTLFELRKTKQETVGERKQTYQKIRPRIRNGSQYRIWSLIIRTGINDVFC